MSIYKNALIIFILDIFIKAKSFITIPLLIHRYGTADYGLWTQLIILGTMLVPFVILGTDIAFQRYMSGTLLSEQVRIFWAWMRAQVIVGMVLCLLLVSLLYLNQQNILTLLGTESALFIILLIMFSGFITNSIRIFFNVRGQIKYLGIFNTSQSLIYILVVILGFYFDVGLLGLLACVVFSDIFISAITLFCIFTRYGYIPSNNFPLFRKFLIFGLPLVPAQFLMLGMNYADRLILPSYVGFSEIGKYALAYQASSLLLQFLLSPFWVLFPSKFAALINNNDLNSADSLYRKSIEALYFIVAPVAVSLMALGSSMLNFYSGINFSQSALIMVLVGVGYYFHLLSCFNDVLLSIHMQQKLTLLSYMIGFGINLSVNFWLIPDFGIIGAALATCFGFLSQYLVTALAVRIYWGGLSFQISYYLKISCMSGVLYLLYRLIDWYELPDIIGTPAALIGGLILYLFLALKFRIFSLQQIKQLVRA